ncbi:hypothetical protein OH76DRAFT_1010911 [Lentinus brumalis]|uniref:Dynamin stalk domain-containing protein n=1 Tax=Lentinus brumalis TaxID=2498619 RepID=A0A371CYD3_9APHY|nr:hypothetical protein OH76DRAFT_1010911 [Polyporus brumalis]
MSKLLTKMTQQSLPRPRWHARSSSATKELNALPPPDPLLFKIDLVTKLCFEVKECVRGSTTHTALVQKNNAVYQGLNLAMGRTAPAFVPFECSGFPRDVFPFVVPEHTGMLQYLEDVKAHIGSSVTRELPHHIPYAAKESLIRDFLETWEHSTMSCFEDVQEKLKHTLSATTDQLYGRFGALNAAGSSIVMEHVSECKAKAEKLIRYHLYSERTLLYTQNKDQPDARRERYLTLYTEARKPVFGTTNAAFKPTPDASAYAQQAHSTTFGQARAEKVDVRLLTFARSVKGARAHG